VKVALGAIDTIRKERGSNAGEIGFCDPWWYNVLYLYTSAKVLIAARLSPAILADVSEEAVLNGWQTAMDILEEHTPAATCIKRLTTTLRLLLEVVSHHYSRFKENSRQTRWDVSSAPQTQIQATVPLPYWCPLDLVDSFSTPQDDQTRALQDDNDALPNDSFPVFDTGFDPNDLSWLMTVPFDTCVHC
jgi:hypothetical protein